LIFIFNLELRTSDEEFLNMPYHWVKAKYARLKKKWEMQEKQQKEMEDKMKQNRSKKR
jgi:hypothetical protein